MRYWIVFFVLFSSSCAAVQPPLQVVKLETKSIDDHIADPPSQELIQEMRFKTGVMQAQRNLLKAIGDYYYAKGWRAGWKSCDKQYKRKLKESK